jgi:hypothetical protein
MGIGFSNAAAKDQGSRDLTFRQQPLPGERVKCSAWAKCLGLPGDCDQTRRFVDDDKTRRKSIALSHFATYLLINYIGLDVC